MDRETPSRTHLPAGLQDHASDHHLGLVRVRLLRVRGKAGKYPVASWTMHTADGETPTHEQHPEDEPEAIAEEVFRAAVDDLADSDNNDKRCCVEFVQVREDKSTTTTEFGWKLDGDLDGLARSTDSAHATFLAEQARYIGDLQVFSLRLLRENSLAIREVTKMIPALIGLRFEALEDRAEAVLAANGVPTARREGEDKSEWVAETGKTARAFLEKFAPDIAATVGWGEAGDVPKDSLRDRLRAFGGSITDEQKPQLIGLIGLSLASKLESAGKAPSDPECLALLTEVLDHAESKLDDLRALLTEEQAQLFEAIFEKIAEMAEAAEKAS